jgi:transcriptional regulator with XRE-family HTH domain
VVVVSDRYTRDWAKLPEIARAETGLEVGEFARRLGTTVQYLARVEKGDNKLGIRMLERIGNTYGLSVASLVGKIEEKL